MHRADLKTGYSYEMYIDDVTRGATWSGVESTTARAPDARAEVATEAVNNGPYAPASLQGTGKLAGTVGLAAFSPVTYQAIVASYPVGYVYGVPLGESSPYYALVKYQATSTGLGGGLPMISTGTIKNVDYTYSTFTTTFR